MSLKGKTIQEIVSFLNDSHIITQVNIYNKAIKNLERVDEIKRNILDEFIDNIFVTEDKNIIIEFKLKNEFENMISFLKIEQKN